MIRVFTVFCKLNEISFSDRQWLKQDLAGFRTCDGGGLSHTISLRFILHVLHGYFLHRKTVAALCKSFGISPHPLRPEKDVRAPESNMAGSAA